VSSYLDEGNYPVFKSVRLAGAATEGHTVASKCVFFTQVSLHYPYTYVDSHTNGCIEIRNAAEPPWKHPMVSLEMWELSQLRVSNVWCNFSTGLSSPIFEVDK
jgi:hypothetical protein